MKGNITDKFKAIYEADKKSFKSNWKIFKAQGKECIEEFKNPKTRYKQIPNALTASRLLAPVFIIPSALSGNLGLTALFVIGFGLTDALDGHIARKHNITSEFGRELDPITDKLFASSLLIPLMFSNPALIINFVMELAIGGINMHSRLNGNKPHTTIVGKIKTAALSLTMLASYLCMLTHAPVSIIASLIKATTILQLISAGKYYYNYKKDEKEKVLDNARKETLEPKIKKQEKTNEKVLVKDKGFKSVYASKGTVEQEPKKEISIEEQLRELKRVKKELRQEEIKTEIKEKIKKIVK